MENKTNSKNAKRRRNSNRNAGYERSLSRMRTSSNEPVHISFYLNSLLDTGGKPDIRKISEFFNMDSTYTPAANGVINSPVK